MLERNSNLNCKYRITCATLSRHAEALELDSKYCPDDYEFKSKKDKVEQTYATWKPGNCWMNRRFHPIVKIRLLYHAKYLHSMEKLSFRAHLIDGPLHKGGTSNIDCCGKSEILLGEENRALSPQVEKSTAVMCTLESFSFLGLLLDTTCWFLKPQLRRRRVRVDFLISAQEFILET